MEQMLTALAQATAFPPTPDIAAGFWRRLETQRTQNTYASPFSLAGVALAALVITIAATLGTVSPARDAAADLFDRINIFETDQPLDELPTNILGEEAPLDDAEFQVGRRILQPTSPEGLELERVLVQDFGSTKAAVLFYTGPGGLRFALFATNSPVGKGLPEGDDSTSVAVPIPEKDVGFWLEGQRVVQYYDRDGNVIPGSVRVTDANTLVWPEGEYNYRIEGDLTQEQAVAIAASVR